MSKAISRLLEQPEEIIAKLVKRLEEKNGSPSHDVRLSAENIQKIRHKVSQLGLDPDDTTAEELFQALQNKFKDDARRFDEHFGLRGQTYDQRIQKAVELVSHNISLADSWVLKKTAAKQLLRQHPPKRVMKILHYRSVDSLIKREDTAQIYLAVEFVESPAWNKAHFKLASSLGSTAFERRSLIIKALTGRWGEWQADELQLISSDYGVLGLLPTKEVHNMSLLAMVALLLEETGAKPSQAAKLSPAAAWWALTDGLLADLAGGLVSFNLKDISLNHSAGYYADKAHRSSAQRHFWQQLLGRYENHPLIDEDQLPQLDLPAVSISPPVNQPAFEYVEDV